MTKLWHCLAPGSLRRTRLLVIRMTHQHLLCSRQRNSWERNKIGMWMRQWRRVKSGWTWSWNAARTCWFKWPLPMPLLGYKVLMYQRLRRARKTLPALTLINATHQSRIFSAIICSCTMKWRRKKEAFSCMWGHAFIHRLHHLTYILHVLSPSQVTTHSHLLSTTEMEALGRELEFSRDQIKWFLLQEFDTEMDFSNKIKWVTS